MNEGAVGLANLGTYLLHAGVGVPLKKHYSVRVEQYFIRIAYKVLVGQAAYPSRAISEWCGTGATCRLLWVMEFSGWATRKSRVL